MGFRFGGGLRYQVSKQVCAWGEKGRGLEGYRALRPGRIITIVQIVKFKTRNARKDSRWQWSSNPWEMTKKSVAAASSRVTRSLSVSTWKTPGPKCGDRGDDNRHRRPMQACSCGGWLASYFLQTDDTFYYRSSMQARMHASLTWRSSSMLNSGHEEYGWRSRAKFLLLSFLPFGRIKSLRSRDYCKCRPRF